jgi:hypothetical protein
MTHCRGPPLLIRKYQNQEESKVKYIKNVEFRSPNLEQTYIFFVNAKNLFKQESNLPVYLLPLYQGARRGEVRASWIPMSGGKS